MTRTKLTLDDLILRESRIIATEILTKRLAELNLPPPKDAALEIHISQLIATDDSIRSLAEERVEAKTDTYTESLKALGLGRNIGEPIDIEL